ncbi:MAG: DNA-binding protein [Actinomycetota bacterium]|nr:DNA-binding protein [Actinomycetota bacterium]
MKTYRSDDGKAAFVSLEPGEDLLDGLNRAVQELGLQAATLQVIGGLEEAKVGYFDRETKQYREIGTGHVEISAGLGNVSLRDGEPFIHLHLALSGPTGATIGGHAMEGCKAFVVEAYFRKLEGAPPTREENPDIGLKVWPGR